MTKGLPASSEVIARRDFQGKTNEQLSFNKGDILTILEDNAEDNNEWYMAETDDGKKGLVPVSHIQRRTEVKLNSTPWFHGKITRDEAERLLQPPKVSIFRGIIVHFLLIVAYLNLSTTTILTFRLSDHNEHHQKHLGWAIPRS